VSTKSLGWIGVGVVAFLTTAGPLLGQARPRIAVIAFDNRTDWWADEMGNVAADMIVTRLVNSGAFSVIERERLNAILEEQGFQLTGQVSPSDVFEIGRMAGVDYLITGSVTRFSIDEKGGRVLGRSVSYTEAESEMNVRAFSTTTGEIVVAAEKSGKKRLASISGVIRMSAMNVGAAEEALRPAADDIVKELLKRSDRFVVTEASAPPAAMPEIVGGGADGSIYLDQGENFGLRVGQRYEVHRVIDEIVNSRGEVLDQITDVVGVIEVTRVLSQSAVSKIVEGEAEEGDTLKPAG
jgi:curli biogenesis system outer membrane secretion channel CsgG